MRVALFALLGVSTQAAVIKRTINEGVKLGHLESRQLESLIPGILSGLLPTLQPVSRDKVTPQFRPDATREVIRYGPLTVKSQGKGGSFLDPAGTDFTQLLSGMCTDCTILSGATSLTFENKTTALLTSGVYNHHILIGEIGKQQKMDMSIQCTNQPKPPTGVTGASPTGQSAPGSGLGGAMPNLPSLPVSQLFGSGHDDTSVDFAVMNSTLNTGFYVPKGDPIFHFTTLVNYRPDDQNVYLTLDMEYINGRPQGYLDASIQALTATGCAGIMYFPPPNKTTTMLGSPMIIQTPGYLFDVKAHLHDGGKSVRLFLNDQPVCTSEAIYGGESDAIEVNGKAWETIQGYTKCSKPIRVEKGDKIALEATYDTAAHPLRPMGGMGEMEGMGGGEGEAMGMASVVYAKDDVPAV